MDVFVAVTGSASVHGVRFGADAADEEALVWGDSVHWEVLDADEDNGGMDGREVGDEVGEQWWYSVREVGVHEANAWHSHQAQAGAQA